MELTQLYASLRRTLAQLDFNDLFPGFHPYPFALYTDENACLDGQLLPRPQEFYGNTAVLRGGRYIAIWNVDLDPPRDMDRFAAHMVHEMFHCHQFTCGETRFPEDLAILACPVSAERFAARHWEYSLLADAFETADPRRLGQFAGLRALRRKMEPEAVVQELKTETAEGMAEFVGLKALHRLSPEQFTRETASYARILRSEDGPLFDSRRMAYYTGALFFLTLERLGRPVVNDFRDPRTAYDQNPVDPEPAPEAVPCRGRSLPRLYPVPGGGAGPSHGGSSICPLLRCHHRLRSHEHVPGGGSAVLPSFRPSAGKRSGPGRLFPHCPAHGGGFAPGRHRVLHLITFPLRSPTIYDIILLSNHKGGFP